MKIIISLILCALASQTEAQFYRNASRSDRAVPTNLAGYNDICANSPGLIRCNSDGKYPITDNNVVVQTKCDATGTIFCGTPNDPRPLQFCTGLTPYCVEPANGGNAECKAAPGPLSSAVATLCPAKPIYQCKDVGDFPDPDDCRKFYRCVLQSTVKGISGQFNIQPTEVNCPTANVFDPTIESRCRYVGPNQANNATLCVNIRSSCTVNSDQRFPVNYPWLLSGKGQYVATCQGPLTPYVTFCPPNYDPNYVSMPASCNVNCRVPYGKIRAYQDPTKYYICIPTNNQGSYMPVLTPCGSFQTFDPVTEKCQFFLGDLGNLLG